MSQIWNAGKNRTELTESLSLAADYAVEVLEAAKEGEFGRSVYLGSDPPAVDLAKAINDLLAEARRLREEREFLQKQVDCVAQISNLFRSQLGRSKIAKAIVEFAAQHVGDSSAYFLYEKASGFRLKAVHHKDPSNTENLINWSRLLKIVDQLFPEVAKPAKPMIFQGIRSLSKLRPDDPHAEELALESLILTPVTTAENTFGVLAVARDLGNPQFSDRDVELTHTLAGHAAGALENARLLSDQTRLAREAETLCSLARSVISSLGMQERLEMIASSFTDASEAGRCLIVSLVDGAWVPSASYRLTDVERHLFALGRPRLEGTPLDINQVWVQPMIVKASAITEWMSNLAIMLDIGDSILVPITCGGSIRHIAVLDRPTNDKFSGEVLRLLSALSGIASAAIEQGQQIDLHTCIADTLRGTLLPESVPHIEGLEVGFAYEPADWTSGLAGDFYDFISLPGGNWAIVIADVCGKGLQAASRIAMTRFLIRAYALEDPSPASVLDRTNQALSRMISESFVTLAYIFYNPETGLISYANAGHPVMLHCMRIGTSIPYGASGPPLGILSESAYEEIQIQAERGDKLVLFTDGIVEARSDGDMFELEGIERTLCRQAMTSAQETATFLLSEAKEFSGGKLKDDIAVIVARIDRMNLFS